MKKTLFTSGDELPYWHITAPRIEAYAARIGAELVVIPKRVPCPQLVIFDAMARTGPGELGGWIDADIIVAADAPDLFQYGDRLMVCEPRTPQRVHPKWRKGHARHGAPNMRPYPITALASWGHDHGRRIHEWMAAREQAGTIPLRWGDQEALALAIWETDCPMHFYPGWWHRMVAGPDKTLGKTAFAHAAGNTRKPARKSATLRRFRTLMTAREGGLLAG